MSRHSAVKGEGILIFVAILWGSCFTVQKIALDYVGPYTSVAFRFLLGALFLFPVVAVTSKVNTRRAPDAAHPGRAVLWRGGAACGLALFFGAVLQQLGLTDTTSGKAAFLTGMDIVAVAVFSVAVTRKLRAATLSCVLLAVLGMYFLCVGDGFTFRRGDLLELLGAVFWGAQMLFVDKYAKLADPAKLSLIQFLVVGVLSSACMMIFEHPSISALLAGALPILYTAVIEVAVCYTLQAVGQQYVSPVAASLTLNLEAVFAVLFGAIFINETLSGREVLGMALMLTAVVSIQIPVLLRSMRKHIGQAARR